MPGYVLYTWGSVTFETYPLNVHQVSHVTQTDWARKEIAGAASYREWVGEEDEEFHLQGYVFPHHFARHGIPRGGLDHLNVMDNMRRLGQAHVLMRGDGWHHGWFVIERLTRGHEFLGLEGVGQRISFEVSFQRVPVPSDPADFFPAFWSGIT